MPSSLPAITALAPSPTDPKRLLIFVDGRRVAALSRTLVTQLRLEVNQDWTSTRAQQVKEAVDFDRALSKAARWFHRRPLSSAQLKERLARENWPPALAARVTERLQSLGLVDDLSLARQLAEQLLRTRSAGPQYIRAKLQARGLPDTTIDQTLEELLSDDDPLLRARQLLQKKEKSLAGLPAATRFRRLAGFLSRRGFTQETIEAVLPPPEE